MTTMYRKRQAELAATPAGQLAATAMRPGTRWLTPKGEIVTVWMAWTPDPDGDAERVAETYKWPTPGPDHNTEIGLAFPKAPHTRRLAVSEVEGFTPAPVCFVTGPRESHYLPELGLWGGDYAIHFDPNEGVQDPALRIGAPFQIRATRPGLKDGGWFSSLRTAIEAANTLEASPREDA